MSSSFAYPFLRLGSDAVAASPWEIAVNGELQDGAGGTLRHWDYAAGLVASRHVEVDVEAAAQSLSLQPSELRLGCIVVAGTSGARLDRIRSLVFSTELSSDQTTAQIEVEVESRNLSQTISLTTEIVLVAPLNAGSLLSPKNAGSRLWQDQSRFAIEPVTPRFPVEAISFSRMLTAVEKGALWYVDWRAGDYASDFTTAVRLYINEDVPAFIARMHEADALTMRLVMQGMAMQLIRSALEDDAFTEANTFPPRSVGAVISSWVARCFTGMQPATVRSIARNDPGRFAAALGSDALLGNASNA